MAVRRPLDSMRSPNGVLTVASSERNTFYLSFGAAGPAIGHASRRFTNSTGRCQRAKATVPRDGPNWQEEVQQESRRPTFRLSFDVNGPNPA